MPNEPIPCAILYAPSLGEPSGSGAVDGVALRIARMLDHLDPEITAAYTVRVVPSEPYAGGKSFTEVREIVRTIPGTPPALTHRIYGLDYLPALVGEQPEGNMFTQALAVGRLWAWMVWVFFSRVRALDSIGATKKTAVAVGALFLFLLTIYLGLMLCTVVSTALAQIGANPAAVTQLKAVIPSALEPVARAVYHLIVAAWEHGGSVVSALLVLAGLVGLSFEAVRKGLQRLVELFLSFIRYLDGGLGRAACTGKFNDLLEHVLEQKPGRVDVVAYSMGSLIALDALFPSEGASIARTARVTTLATIGCPFDLVRTFWPDYFNHRAIGPSVPRWINVFSPVDLLGSNFANQEGAVPAPTHGINVTDPATKPGPGPSGQNALLPASNLDYDHAGRKLLDVPNALFGGAYFAHSQYWLKDNTQAESCFNLLVPVLYPVPRTSAVDPGNPGPV